MSIKEKLKQKREIRKSNREFKKMGVAARYELSNGTGEDERYYVKDGIKEVEKK